MRKKGDIRVLFSGRRRVFFCLAILWMACIFLFSARTDVNSTRDSHLVGEFVAGILEPDFEEWTEEEQEDLIASIDFPIRKAAHALEYALLALLWLGAFLPAGKELSFGKPSACAWLLTAAYAATDEFHQLFVPGRSGQLTDVGIDGLGAAAGLAAACFLIRGIRRRRQ